MKSLAWFRMPCHSRSPLLRAESLQRMVLLNLLHLVCRSEEGVGWMVKGLDRGIGIGGGGGGGGGGAKISKLRINVVLQRTGATFCQSTPVWIPPPPSTPSNQPNFSSRTPLTPLASISPDRFWVPNRFSEERY